MLCLARKDHLPRHHVLLDNYSVITINVNQVETLDDTGRDVVELHTGGYLPA